MKNPDKPLLQAISGQSRDGQPLAYHRAPAPDLAPWIARLFVTSASQPVSQTLSCGLFNDTSFIRLMVCGAWEGRSDNQPFRANWGTLLFGPHGKRMPIAVTGPFTTFGFALRPGAQTALGNPWGRIGLDQISKVPDFGLHCPASSDEFAQHSPDYWLDRIEDILRNLVAERAPGPPDSLTEALDLAAFADPNEAIGEFARRCRVSPSRLERTAQRDFRLSPKQVMRRARVLDMASQLLGFAHRAEAEEHALRFYDQSHQIRDFRELIGMTPRELALRPQPILTLGLEARQARRLEMLGRLEAGTVPPWR